MNSLIITPKTKIYDLLAAFPQLEEVLIQATPQFKKLRNPVLKNTIAKVTTLAQAAIIAGLNVEVFVNKLREEVGQKIELFESTESKFTVEKPDWFDEDLVAFEIDVREMLNAGEHPVHDVLAAIKRLNENEILKIEAPFVPAPLIDKTIGLGHKHWLIKRSEDDILIYFRK